METTDFCSYELSKRLKDCGFDEPCYFYYTRENAPEDHVWSTTSEEAPIDYNKSVYAGCSMPTLAQAQKWLREKKGFFVEVTSEALHDWDYFILELDEDVNAGLARGKEIYESYEQALSAGISASLQLIEKGE